MTDTEGNSPKSAVIEAVKRWAMTRPYALACTPNRTSNEQTSRRASFTTGAAEKKVKKNANFKGESRDQDAVKAVKREKLKGAPASYYQA